MKKQIITLAVVALLLSSCGIYTKYCLLYTSDAADE